MSQSGSVETATGNGGHEFSRLNACSYEAPIATRAAVPARSSTAMRCSRCARSRAISATSSTAVLRNDNHASAVGDDEVARAHRDGSDGHRRPRGRFVDSSSRSDGRATSGEDREAQLACLVDVAAGTIDNHAVDTAHRGGRTQESTPSAHAEPTSVVDDDDPTGPGLVDRGRAEMDRRRRWIGRAFCQSDRHRSSDHARALPQRSEPSKISRKTHAIERIADDADVESFECSNRAVTSVWLGVFDLTHARVRAPSFAALAVCVDIRREQTDAFQRG